MPASQLDRDVSAKDSTYRSTSLRCTDLVPPHIGIVMARGGGSACDSSRRLEECAGASVLQGASTAGRFDKDVGPKSESRTGKGARVRR